MVIPKEEKILLLGSLFHDIGKFQQRCGVRTTTKHQTLGKELIDEFYEQFLKIVEDEASAEKIKYIIENHHNKNEDNFTQICRTADHLSASERVGFDKEDEWKDRWSHKYLSSLFSKIYLNDKEGKEQRYYQHQILTKKNYKILIPQFSDEEDLKEERYNYQPNDFESFKSQLRAVLEFYETDADFVTLINLLLILFEKYMWCIPDFTGSADTDISLYNHLKDVAGISHAIYKSDKEGSNLNLIIGDLPGIQKYIFNVAYKNPAKVLRGRSIFVQIITRQFATIMLDKLGLTDANLIMLAGGKFYILAQDSKDFEEKFSKAKDDIEHILIENFNYQLSFSSAFETFDYTLLMEKDKTKRKTFGDVIDKASYNLLLKRNQQFEYTLFEKDDFDENYFVLSNNYFKPNETDTNKVKDAVTGLPIREGHQKKLPNSDENEYVDRQVYNEIRIGAEAPQSNVVVLFDENYSTVKDVKKIKEYKPEKNDKRILINPDLDELIKPSNIKKDILRNIQIIEVANYTSWDEKEDHVLEFDKIEEQNNGAKFLTLIKGDVDNLGLIMSSGLVDDKDDYTAISRTTTLSNHLKYFFSFSLNGLLRDWNIGKLKSEFDATVSDQKVYTVFAGGDDLMLISPQSSSLKLLNELNKTFTDFVCENPEVHISYSLTNFKHNTPIRIVADMAEENQSKIKAEFKSNFFADNKKVFYPQNDKAGTRLFNTNIKNALFNKILNYRKDLIIWEMDEKNKVTQGVLRNLLFFSKIIKDFNEKEDSRLLMWHPKLTYMINRLLKDKNGKYVNPEISEFFNIALKINKGQDIHAIILEQILYPVVCEAIYGTRNSKGE